MLTPRSRLPRGVVLALAAAAIVLVGVAAFAAHALSGSGKPKLGPPPPLFPPAALRVVDGPLRAAERRADADFARWAARNPRASAAAFGAWAQSTLPAPPTGAAQQRELRFLHGLPARQPAGDAAATWLEQHGDKDLWKLFLKQERQLLPKPAAARAKAMVKAALKLGKTLQGQAKNRFARPSPYITDPTLGAINQGKAKTKGKFSYPSKHATMAVAAVTVLSHVAPLRAAELQRWLEQVLYSRLYARGHYPSDLAAGERLGRLIGDYELRSAAAA